MALREIQHRPIYAVLFALSIAVGMASLMALAGVSGAVKKNMTDQAKELWTADVTVKGSEDVLNDVEDWARRRWDGARENETGPGWNRGLFAFPAIRVSARARGPGTRA